MPNIRTRSALAAALLPLALALALPAAAQSPRGEAATAPPPAWDQLTDAQRELLVAPVRERWNDNPDKRARMLAHAERWRDMPPEQRERARRGVHRWEGMEPEERDAMRALYAHMRTLPEAERSALRERWKAMTPVQRREWVKAHPAPAPVPHRER